MHRQGKSPKKIGGITQVDTSCESLLRYIIIIIIIIIRRSSRKTIVYETVKSLLAVHTFELSTWSCAARGVHHNITDARTHRKGSSRSYRLWFNLICTKLHPGCP